MFRPKLPSLVILAAALSLGIWFVLGDIESSSSTALLEPSEDVETPAELEAAEEDEVLPTPLAAEPGDDRQTAEVAPVESGLRVSGRVQMPESSAGESDLWAYLAPRSMSYGRFLTWMYDEETPPARSEVAPDGSFSLPLPDDQEGSAWVMVRGHYFFSPRTTALDPEDADPSDPILLERGAHLAVQVVAPADSSSTDPGTEEPPVLLLAQSDVQLDPMMRGDNLGITSLKFPLGPDYHATFGALPAGKSYTLKAVDLSRASTDAALSEILPGEDRTALITLSGGSVLEGVVRDEAGLGVSGATVSAFSSGFFGSIGSAPERKVTCDEEGRFRMGGLTPGEATLGASAPGYLESERLKVEALENRPVTDLGLLLTRGASITGTLLWKDGRPAGDIQVKAHFDETHGVGLTGLASRRGAKAETTSRADGTFTVTGLGSGPFRLNASTMASPLELQAGGTGAESTLEVSWSARAVGIQPGTYGVVLTLEAHTAIVGRVVDVAGEPVPKYWLIQSRVLDGPAAGLIQRAAKKGERFKSPTGEFLIKDLSPGSYTIWVQDDDHVSPETVNVEVPLVKELVLTVLPTATVSGSVHSSDGAPVEGAEVRTGHGATLKGMMAVGVEAASTLSGPGGAFELKGIPPGETLLVARSEGWAPSPGLPADLSPGEVLTGVRLELRLGGTLTGEVYASDGTMASGHMVTVIALDSMTSGSGFSQLVGTTDASGAFQFDHLQEGPWQVTAINMAGGVGGELDLGALLSNMEMSQADIIDGETVHVILGAPPENPVQMSGTVTLGGEPFAGANVSFFPEGADLYANLEMTAVGEDGRYQVTLNGPGGYVANVQKLIGTTGQQSTIEYRVEVPAVAEFRHDFELPLGRLAGRVIGPDGGPAAGERVTITLDANARSDRMFGGQYSELVTDAAGRFDVIPLRPGVYRVSAGGAPVMGIGEGHLGRVTLGGIQLGENQFIDDLILELPEAGSITLTAVGPDGVGVTGATVFVRDETGRSLEPFSMLTTGPGGQAQIEGIAPGEYTLLVRNQDLCSPESAPVHVRTGQSSEVSLTLGPGTIVKVQLQLKEGREPVRGTVRVLDAAGRDYANLFGLQDLQYLYLDGGFSPTEHRFGPLPPGRYMVQGESGGDSANKPVTLKGGERKVVLRLK